MAKMIARQKTASDLPDRAAWEQDGEVYIGAESGGPNAARWECSVFKWSRWFEDVYRRAGWIPVCASCATSMRPCANSEPGCWHCEGCCIVECI